MELLDRLNFRLKKAMTEKDEKTLLVLRSLISEIKNKEIEAKFLEKELDDKIVEGVIKKEAKKRKDAIELYKKGGRNDLANKESEELKIIEDFLPNQLSERDIKKIVVDIINNFSGNKNFGAIMRVVMNKLEGFADGSIVSRIVKEELEE